MTEYLLEFPDDNLGEPKKVRFKADTPSAAISLLENEGVLRHVKIWQGERLLGDIMRDGQGVWHLNEDPF